MQAKSVKNCSLESEHEQFKFLEILLLLTLGAYFLMFFFFIYGVQVNIIEMAVHSKFGDDWVIFL